MRKSRLAVLLAVPLIAAVAQTAAVRRANPPADPAPRYSPEKLAKIRQALVAQIAVYERAEGAMRAPTPAEAARLAASPSGTAAEVVSVTGGGVALRPDVSQLSFAVAETGEDGTVEVTHGPPSRATKPGAGKGGSHVR